MFVKGTQRGDRVDPGGNTACELVNLVVDEVGKSDNLWRMGRLEGG